MPHETMDTEQQIEALNAALRLQHRSALQYSLTAGSLTGFDHLGLSESLARFARAEIDDARHLVEKITALGGEPTHEVAPLKSLGEPRQAIAWLLESEGEALEALQDAIEPTGREAASEAIEHRLEHVIMRKQEQVDLLLRGTRA